MDNSCVYYNCTAVLTSADLGTCSSSLKLDGIWLGLGNETRYQYGTGTYVTSLN